MCPASASTTMPSGNGQSLTMTLRSEPSGFTENTRPRLKPRTNKRPTAPLAPDLTFDFKVCVPMFFSFWKSLLCCPSFLCSREVWRTLLNECPESFPGLRRARSRGELLILDFYGLLDLLA